MTCVVTARRVSDIYLILLELSLLGYALIGKGFAYLGFPPLFIGEVALFTGAIVFLRMHCLIATLATLPSLLLAATMVLVLLRTLPYLGTYGIDALRDSVVVMYGGFAFIVIALLLEDTRRVGAIVHCYDRFLKVLVPVAPVIIACQRYFGNDIPNLPGTNVHLVEVRPEELAVHLTGAAVFTLVGFRRASPLWWGLVLALLSVLAALSRGAMIASVVPIMFATLILGRWRSLTLAIVTGGMIFAAAYAVEPLFSHFVEARSTSERSISTRQIADNITSIVTRSGEQTESTKTWRLEWWNIIVADTLFGPHFWTGRGFGLNLADADGFQDGDHPDLPALRSPHDVHMTMLARAGVPGVALWFCLLLSWFVMVMRALVVANRCAQVEWVGLFVFISCYVMSIVINATFDVVLEGPMQGIWFWSLIGFGIGAVMVHRCGSVWSSVMLA